MEAGLYTHTGVRDKRQTSQESKSNLSNS